MDSVPFYSVCYLTTLLIAEIRPYVSSVLDEWEWNVCGMVLCAEKRGIRQIARLSATLPTINLT